MNSLLVDLFPHALDTHWLICSSMDIKKYIVHTLLVDDTGSHHMNLKVTKNSIKLINTLNIHVHCALIID